MLILDLLHPSVWDHWIRSRVILVQEGAPDTQVMSVDKRGQLLLHDERCHLLVFKIAGLLRFQPVNLLQMAKCSLQARIQLSTREVESQLSLMWLVARQSSFRLFPVDAAQQVVHRNSKQ